MERSDLPTGYTCLTPPNLRQARAGAWPQPAQCLPLPRLLPTSVRETRFSLAYSHP